MIEEHFAQLEHLDLTSRRFSPRLSNNRKYAHIATVHVLNNVNVDALDLVMTATDGSSDRGDDNDASAATWNAKFKRDDLSDVEPQVCEHKELASRGVVR